jgi:hypothetical protein
MFNDLGCVWCGCRCNVTLQALPLVQTTPPGAPGPLVLQELMCELLTALSCQMVLPLGPEDARYEVTLKAVAVTATSCNLTTADIISQVSRSPLERSGQAFNIVQCCCDSAHECDGTIILGQHNWPKAVLSTLAAGCTAALFHMTST